MLDEIHTRHMELPVREETILHMHKTMLDIANYPYGGQYKQDDNLIMEVDASGKRRVRFTPVSARETKDAMEQQLARE